MDKKVVAALFGAACATLVLAACGGSGASQDELNEARKQGEAKAHQRQTLAEIKKELKALRQGRGSSSSGSGSAPESVHTGAEGNCGGGLSANSVTTCGFAENVENDYYEVVGSGSGSVYSFSPTTGKSYGMFCTGGEPHECTGGNEAYVSFP